MAGGDQVNSLKQFVGFGLKKQMAVGGTLFELESLRAVPHEAKIGWWTMDGGGISPTPAGEQFNKVIKENKARRLGAALVRLRGGAHAHSHRQSGENARAPKLAKALHGFKLPPEVALQPHQPFYRAGDHELMSTVSSARRTRRKGDPDNMFTVRAPVPGEKAAGPAEGTGCNDSVASLSLT